MRLVRVRLRTWICGRIGHAWVRFPVTVVGDGGARQTEEWAYCRRCHQPRIPE